MLLGPVANWFFLRYYGGDKENEAAQTERYKRHNALKYQELELWKTEKNSVWPDAREVLNPWVWGCVGFGSLLGLTEEIVKGWYDV